MQDSVYNPQYADSGSGSNDNADWFKDRANTLNSQLSSLSNINIDSTTVGEIYNAIFQLNQALFIKDKDFSVELRSDIDNVLKPLIKIALTNLGTYYDWLEDRSSGERFTPEERRTYREYLQGAITAIGYIVSFLQSV